MLFADQPQCHHPEHHKQRRGDHPQHGQRPHAQERDAGVEDHGKGRHRQRIPAEGLINHRAGKAGLEGIPADHHRREKTRDQDVAFAAKGASGLQSKVHSAVSGVPAQRADIGEQHQVAQQNGDQRGPEAQMPGNDAAKQRIGEDHRESKPDR